MKRGFKCRHPAPQTKILTVISLLFYTSMEITIMAMFDDYIQFSLSVVSDSLQLHRLQHANPPCPSPTPGACSNSCPSSWWCHPAISTSVIPISSCLQSFPTLGSFQMSQFFASSGQSIGVSAWASVLPMNIQDCFTLGFTGWISLQSKELSRVFSNTTVEKHQFFSSQLSWFQFSHPDMTTGKTFSFLLFL